MDRRARSDRRAGSGVLESRAGPDHRLRPSQRFIRPPAIWKPCRAGDARDHDHLCTGLDDNRVQVRSPLSCSDRDQRHGGSGFVMCALSRGVE